MPAYSMARPRSATPTGATTRPIQKLPRTLTAVPRRYAPTAKSAPWAKFGMLRIPVMSDRPRPIRAYSMPVAIPLRIWPASRLKAEGSEASDVLAGRVFLGQRRIPGGDDVREVELVLHRRLRLAAQVEVRANPQVVADLRRELHQLLHARGPAHDERHLGREAEVEDLARAGDGVAAEVDHRHSVGPGRGRLLHVV